MAQFDYYAFADGHGFWIDCQTEPMERYDSRFVVPLVPEMLAPQPGAARLNPRIEFGGDVFVLLAQFAGTLPRAELGRASGSLEHERYAIMNALDFLISGV